MPTKLEVQEAFHSSVLSNKQAGAILYTIALKDIDSEYSDTKTSPQNHFLWNIDAKKMGRKLVRCKP